MLTVIVALMCAPNPLTMSLLTILQSVVVAFITWSFIKDPWVVMLFLMIYFGGVMVLLIYVCSLTPLDKTSVHMRPLLVALPLTVLLDCELTRMVLGSLESTQTGLVTLLNSGFYVSAGFLIVYLLMGLVVVVKVSKFYKGALRQI